MPVEICVTCNHLSKQHSWNDRTAEYDCAGGHECACAFYIARDWKKL